MSMSKAKNNFIGGIITLVTSLLLLTTGIILVTMPKKIDLIFGIIVIVCAVAVFGLSIFLIVKNNKIVKQEKKQSK